MSTCEDEGGKNRTGYLITRFFAVGILNTIFGYSFFAMFLYIGLHYALALLLAGFAGVIFNFKSTGVLVFKSHNNRLIFRFIAVYVLMYGVNVTFLRLLYEAGVGTYLGGAILIIPMALLAFLLNKNYVFSHSKVI